MPLCDPILAVPAGKLEARREDCAPIAGKFDAELAGAAAVLKVVAAANFGDSQIIEKMIHHIDEAVAIPSGGFEGGLRRLSGSP